MPARRRLEGVTPEGLARPFVVGVVHARPLPGSPRYGGSLDEVRTAALHDAAALAEGGVDGLLLENFGDAPLARGRVGPETIAHLTALALEIRRRFPLPLGINVLRNDGLGALAVAQAAGAYFIRVNVLAGAYVTDQGLVEGIAHDLARARRAWGADGIRILADLRVKHAAPWVERPIADEAHDLVSRSAADALIVTGPATGAEADAEKMREARAAVAVPLLVGSGVTPRNVTSFAEADGFIVGTALKHEGRTDEPVDRRRVETLMAAVGAL